MKNQQLLELWRGRIDACRASGLKVSEYCKKHSLATRRYYYWKLRVERCADIETNGKPGKSPTSGQWLCVEPIVDEFAYQYANNMPTTATDPSGKDVYEHLSDHELEWTERQGWIPDSVKHAAAEELNRRHPSAPPPATQNTRTGAAGHAALQSAGTAKRQGPQSPPPNKSAAPPVGPNAGNSHATAPPNANRMAGQGANRPPHPNPQVQGSALVGARLSQYNAYRAQAARDWWVAGIQGAGHGLVEGEVAVGDAFSFGLGSRLGLVPKEFQNDPIYQTAYGYAGIGRDTLITVGTLGAGSPAVLGARGGGVLARIGITKAPEILGATVRVAPAVQRAASLYNTGQGIYGLGAAGYHAATHQLSIADIPNVAFGGLTALHLGVSYHGGGAAGLFDAAIGGVQVPERARGGPAAIAQGRADRQVYKVVKGALRRLQPVVREYLEGKQAEVDRFAASQVNLGRTKVIEWPEAVDPLFVGENGLPIRGMYIPRNDPLAEYFDHGMYYRDTADLAEISETVTHEFGHMKWMNGNLYTNSGTYRALHEFSVEAISTLDLNTAAAHAIQKQYLYMSAYDRLALRAGAVVVAAGSGYVAHLSYKHFHKP